MVKTKRIDLCKAELPEMNIILLTLILFCFLKAVVHREGNKLKVSLKGIESVTELVDGNTIVNVSKQNAFLY